MKISSDHWVEFHYELLDARGHQVETTADDGPVRYLHGHDEILPGLERALLGRRPGERFEISLAADEAYGAYDPEGIVSVPRSEMPEDEEISPGTWLTVSVEADGDDEEDADEREMELRVVEIHPEEVILDANHPLAGQDVTFRITIVSVEPQTES